MGGRRGFNEEVASGQHRPGAEGPAGLRRGPGEGQQTHFLSGLPQAGKVSL